MFELNDLDRLIEAEVATPVPAEETNIGDAPVESDEILKIIFGDLSDSKKYEIENKLLKNMKATDEISRTNLIKTLNENPIFDGTVEEFRNLIGVENV
jgi:hypothetical protein